MANNLFIYPTNLSAPSSPSGSSCIHEDIDPTHSAGPARKRVRTQDMTCEERKEARAHRNRVAAQNSRDRRKSQFSYLERRVAELEEENRRLRAGAGIRPADPICVREDRVSADRARELENEELKERIRTLERGWDVIIKALAAQGLPSLSSASKSTTTADVEPSSSAKPSVPIPTSCVIPGIPSPAASHSSVETESTVSCAGNTSSGTEAREESRDVGRETTRHLAAGGLTVGAETANFRSSVHASTPSQASRKLSITVTPNVGITNNPCNSSGCEDDDKVMEALFREIASSPCTTQDTTSICLESAAVIESCDDEIGSGRQLGVEGHTSFVDQDTEFRTEEWTTEMETEKMLDEIIALTGLGETFATANYPDIGNLGMSALSGWDMDAVAGCIGAH